MQAVALKTEFVKPHPVAHGKMMDRGTPFEGRPDKGRLLDPDLPAVPGEPDRTDLSPTEYSADLDRYIYYDCHGTIIVNICSPVNQISNSIKICIICFLASYTYQQTAIFFKVTLYIYLELR